MTITIASDHAGFELKETIKRHYATQFEFMDCGTFSSESVDYPIFAHALADAVLANGAKGILICGSGNGVSMSANKHQGIRAALCWNEEVAQLARQHNDANVLSLPARFIDESLAFKIIDIFLTTPFEGGRHAKRVDEIDLLS